jgi:hypothetical protein
MIAFFVLHVTMHKAHKCKTFPKHKGRASLSTWLPLHPRPLILRLPLPHPSKGSLPYTKDSSKTDRHTYPMSKKIRLPRFLHILCQNERSTIVIYVCMYIYTQIHMYMFVSIHTHTCIHTYIYTYYVCIVHTYVVCVLYTV